MTRRLIALPRWGAPEAEGGPSSVIGNVALDPAHVVGVESDNRVPGKCCLVHYAPADGVYQTHYIALSFVECLDLLGGA